MIKIDWCLKDIASQLGGTLLGETNLAEQKSLFLVYDSRRIYEPENSLFLAMAGNFRDGHDFIPDAYQRGVRLFLLEKPEHLPKGACGLLVKNTLHTLQELARSHRSAVQAQVIAITGSNGKTIVKEWLAEILARKYRISQSPGSYNSQLGVALSLLQIPEKADFALVEAGISKPGEMQVLEQMIQPEFGILTHFGDAHGEGFKNDEEKLREKLQLFQEVETVFVSADDKESVKTLQAMGLPIKQVGWDSEADLRVISVEKFEEKVTIQLLEGKEVEELEFMLTGKANLENVLLVILAARAMKISWDLIRTAVAGLCPVSMRMEMHSDNPEITIFNDSYNADQASVLNAFSLLSQSTFQTGQALILSDLEHQGARQEQVQRELLDQAVANFGLSNIILIGPVFWRISLEYTGLSAYENVDQYAAAFDYLRFRNKTVLLKGARRFELERLIPYLSRRAAATWFKADLNNLAWNFRQFRKHLSEGTKIMCMVKAFAYGAGDWEVAQALEIEGVDYLGLAYTSAGIELRARGIKVPIMVMNADRQSMEQLFHFDLEPAVYSLSILQEYLATGRQLKRDRMPVHIKVDTGMSRLGFSPSELSELKAFLKLHPQIEVRSIMSHLAMADDPSSDNFTKQQVAQFRKFSDGLMGSLDSKPMQHLLNTAGIIRFPQFNFDMVRLGLGLYGVSPVEGTQLDLREVGSMYSEVTQVHEYAAGTPIGYGGTAVTDRPSRIATVAAGYADGIRRSLGNGKMSFLIRGRRAPVIGRICMDMLMLDVTDISGVAAGDEAVLLGNQGDESISVQEMAALADTIPYEILVNIGQRVRRVYHRE